MTEVNRIVEARPKVVREEREEIVESLRLVELRNAGPEDKRRIEASAAEGAREVEYFERAWIKQSPESSEDIRRAVDRMRHGDAPAAAAEPAPVTKAAVPPTPGSGILTVEEMRLAEAFLSRPILSARVLYRTSRGKVAEVEYETEEGPKTTLLSLVGGNVKSLETIESELDRKPVVPSPAYATAVVPPTPTVAAREPGAGSRKPETPAAEPTTAAPPEAEEKKGRFGFLKRAERPAGPEPSTKEPESGAGEERKKKRFSFFKK
ncbi:MAG: hypothetical protein ACT4PT_10225 [Methanobacteriota archaeon]